MDKCVYVSSVFLFVKRWNLRHGPRTKGHVLRFTHFYNMSSGYWGLDMAFLTPLTAAKLYTVTAYYISHCANLYR